MYNEVNEVQLSIDASQEIMKDKLKKQEERFEKGKNENIESLKSIEIGNSNIKNETVRP